MASLSYYGALMFFFASTMASFALAASQYKINDPNCDSTIVTNSLENYNNLTILAMDQISKSSLDFAVNGTLEQLIIKTSPNDKLALSALGSCRVLISLTSDNLNNSLISSSDLPSREVRQDALSCQCFAGSNLAACIDEFNSSASQIQDFVSARLYNSIDTIRTLPSNILYEMDRCYNTAAFDSSGKADHFVEQYNYSNSARNPSWLSAEDDELIQSAYIKPNIIVAKDGTGNYRTINDAIKAIPINNNKRFYIYVKKGVYFENVMIGLNQWNVVMFGDGMDKTIVSAKLNIADGYTIFSSATFGVQGKRFFARDIGFFNTAGADKGQAVALWSASDRSVFYRCRIDGYQDALNAHIGHQFYRECKIYGTIDFIFGGAAVVIQKSTIFAKRPLFGQGNAIAAHSRMDPRCPTAIVIQSSYITASENLGGASTALGRPWKPFSVVVYMQNYMDSLIIPAGWVPMIAGTPPGTIFLAEYANRGPGSNVAGRVRWNGVRVNLNINEANRYTVSSLLGGRWISGTNVSYDRGL